MLCNVLKLCSSVPAQTNACLMLKALSVLALHLEDCSRVLLAENAPRNGSLACHVPLVTQTSQSQFQLLASTLQSTTLIECNPCYIEKRSASQQWQCTLFRCCRPIDSLSAYREAACTLLEPRFKQHDANACSNMLPAHSYPSADATATSTCSKTSNLVSMTTASQIMVSKLSEVLRPSLHL